MTAEVAIINRHAVVLAADSAITVNSSKVYNNANKLFELNCTEPVGIMVYGNAAHQGQPWEALIKTYRKEKSGVSFDCLSEYADSFFNYLGESRFSRPDAENIEVLSYVVLIVKTVADQIEGVTKRQFPSKFKSSVEDLSTQALDTMSLDAYGDHDLSEFERIYGGACDDLFKEGFSNYIISKTNLQLARKLVFDGLTHQFLDRYAAGCVVAGFGKGEIFPSLVSFLSKGTLCGKLLVGHHGSRKIEQENGMVLSFAQSDVSTLFMEGISERNKEVINANISQLLETFSDEVFKTIGEVEDEGSVIVSKELLRRKASIISKEFIEGLTKFRAEDRVKPTVKVVGNLPKEEMALMAEAMVDLTSLRRKISDSKETVGGPVDVAIISKGDGFIWWKRKHYFSPELNSGFFIRRKAIK